MLPIWLSRHLCTSPPHLSPLSLTKLTTHRTLTHLCEPVPMNSQLDPLTRVKESRHDLMAHCLFSQAEASRARPSMVNSHPHVFLSGRGCTLHIKKKHSLSLLETLFTITLTNKLNLCGLVSLWLPLKTVRFGSNSNSLPQISASLNTVTV